MKMANRFDREETVDKVIIIMTAATVAEADLAAAGDRILYIKF
jgi:hypothetical protein